MQIDLLIIGDNIELNIHNVHYGLTKTGCMDSFSKSL